MTKILNVTPISQLFPIPMIMGCEGVCAAMILQYNDYPIKATDIMKSWPKHPNNPYKGYVGHQIGIKFGYHQTIFPTAFVPHLQQFNTHIEDSTGQSLHSLERVITQGQPVVIYHTVLGKRPIMRTFKFENRPTKIVSNIHTTVLVGYDDTHYYYIDPLWSHFGKAIILPALVPNKFQLLKISKARMEKSFNAPGRMSFYLNYPTTNTK